MARRHLPPDVLVLGDAHADDPDNRAALLSAYRAAEEEENVAIQVGDLLYYDVPMPTWFVAGNNEAFDVIDALRRGDSALTDSRPRLLASTAVELEGLHIAGLSGNYAPTQYDRPRSELTGDRRRHFVREEVERTANLSDVDVLLTHEAPHGVVRIGGRDVGCNPVDELLSELEPTLCLVGHYHRHVEGEFGETRVVSLAPVWESYYTLDPEAVALERHDTPDEPS